MFDLMVEKEEFISGLETLEMAVSSFLHLYFVANLTYPAGSGILCTFLQRCVAKIDEHGTTSDMKKKDKASKVDKAARPFKKLFDDFRTKVYDIAMSE